MSDTGKTVKVVQEPQYCGALVNTKARDGNVKRRIGEASQSVQILRAVWSHANITGARKLSIYHACILPKVLYSLEATCCRRLVRHPLDGFHARCVRTILGIAHRMWSHISNRYVLLLAGARPLSLTLPRNQLLRISERQQWPPVPLSQQM